MTKKILFILPSALLLTLSSCGGASSSSSEPDDSPSISEEPQSSATESESLDSGEEASVGETGSSSENILTPEEHLALALDESNFANYQTYTGVLPGDYGDPLYWRTFYLDDYQVVFDETLSYAYGMAYYMYFHDYGEVSHVYFDKSSYPNGKPGWIAYNEEYGRGLGLPYQYADDRPLLAILKEHQDKLSYEFGYFYLDDRDVLGEIASKALPSQAYIDGVSDFYLPDFTSITTLRLKVDEESEKIEKIQLFDENIDTEENMISIEFSSYGENEIGKGILSTAALPEEPSEDNVVSWWEYKGLSGPIVFAYPTGVAISVKDSQESSLTLEIEDTLRLAHTCSYQGLEGIEEDRIVYYGNGYGEYRYESTNAEAVEVDSLGNIAAIAAGEADVYAVVYGKEGEEIESNRIHFVVNPLPEQDLSAAVYDLSFLYYEEVGADNNPVYGEDNRTKVAVNNSFGNSLPVEMRISQNARLLNNAKSGPFVDETALSLSMYNAHADAIWDFADQQVSSLSFYYAGYYTNSTENPEWLKAILIETSNDGENWEQIDITEEILAHNSIDNFKLLERSFAPSSKVRLSIESKNFIGKNYSFALPGIVFSADENCHHHGQSEEIGIESIEISSLTGLTEVREGKTLQFRFAITPEDATDKTVAFFVEDETVASITEKGLLTGIKPGTTKVYATDQSGIIKSNEIEITVTALQALDARLIGSFKSSEDYGSDAFKATIEEKKAVLVFSEADVLTLDYTDYDKDSRDYVFTDENSNVFSVRYDASYDRLSFTLTGTHNINKYTENVYLLKYILPESIEIFSSVNGEMKIGATATISASFSPVNATEKSWKLESSDSNIVEVTAGDGYSTGNKSVKAKATGSVILTATSENGLTATLTLAVAAPIEVTSITVSLAKTEIEVNQTTQASATILPLDADDKSLIWSSSNPSVATVDSNGLVKGIAPGEAEIKATSKNGSVFGTATITVTEAEEGTLTLDDFAGSWMDDDGMVYLEIGDAASENIYIEDNMLSVYEDATAYAILGDTLTFETENYTYALTLNDDDTITLVVEALGDHYEYILYSM